MEPTNVVRWTGKRGTFRVLDTFTDRGGPTAKLVAKDGSIRFARISELRVVKPRKGKASRRPTTIKETKP